MDNLTVNLEPWEYLSGQVVSYDDVLEGVLLLCFVVVVFLSVSSYGHCARGTSRLVSQVIVCMPTS